MYIDLWLSIKDFRFRLSRLSVDRLGRKKSSITSHVVKCDFNKRFPSYIYIYIYLLRISPQLSIAVFGE